MRYSNAAFSAELSPHHGFPESWPSFRHHVTSDLRGSEKVWSLLTSHRHFVAAVRMGWALLLPNALLTLLSWTNLMTTWVRPFL